jgi:hypothetical protein
MVKPFQYQHPQQSRMGIKRRAVLQAGGLIALGLTSAHLSQLRASTREEGNTTNRRQNSCVFLFLFGGPSQIDLWDMKPNASAEVRGEFQPIATNVPGIEICEHLPRLAQQMDKLCLMRSMQHNMNVHGPACSEVFSGRPYHSAPITDQATPEDWPSLSSMTMRYGSSQTGLPPSIVLPWYLQFPGQSEKIAGQTGGRMGKSHDAMLIQGDGSGDFQVDGLSTDITAPLSRIENRRRLSDQLRIANAQLSLPQRLDDDINRHRERAFSLLHHNAGEILDLRRESASLREAYGHTSVGQSLLMARRMIEAGVSLVTVNWEDETKISGTNTCWDTHEDNFNKLKTLLCPMFDQAFPTFLQDLDDHGLLETTLVVAVGEFGRTPKLGQFTQSSNTKKSGRDHWPHAFTALLAGGGVRGGQVYGSTDRHAAYVTDSPVSPADLSATILHHLGVDHTLEYQSDNQGLRHRLSDGNPVRNLG